MQALSRCSRPDETIRGSSAWSEGTQSGEPEGLDRSLLVVVASWRLASAHEVRPGYLELRETAPDRYQVLWKQPALGEMRLKIDPVFPADCTLVGERIRQLARGAFLDRMTIACDGGLPGKTVGVAGLEATLTDVLVRIQLADRRAQTELLKPSRPSFAVSGSAPSGGAAAYFVLGVEHLLPGRRSSALRPGVDAPGGRPVALFKTITAFTLGHSASLALATLGLVRVPGPPLNAAIALGIVFLAAEIVRQRRGEWHLTARHPWIVSGTSASCTAWDSRRR